MTVAEINKVIRPLAKLYRFGYMTTEDMVQTGWIFVLQILKQKPDCNSDYLSKHLRTRFIPIKFEWVKGGKV